MLLRDSKNAVASVACPTCGKSQWEPCEILGRDVLVHSTRLDLAGGISELLERDAKVATEKRPANSMLAELEAGRALVMSVRRYTALVDLVSGPHVATDEDYARVKAAAVDVETRLDVLERFVGGGLTDGNATRK